ncbi:MAG: GGDEF domain-containing protein [Acidobacteria bacterium]|nr:GGDEF domain-containing protein [Acidobacteriota bacterium]
MITLKRYLDQSTYRDTCQESEYGLSETILKAYCAGLTQMGECGVDACPDLAPEFSRGLKRIVESLGPLPAKDSVIASEDAVRELLRGWGKQVSSHYDQKASDVKDLLLVMTRTAESLGNKDERVARQIDGVSQQLKSIVNLNDVSRIRASVEASARELRESLSKMTAEGKALVEHLRAEVSTYQTKLEKAERISSCDALTGLGSRHWIESRIQERIVAGSHFSIVLIDIESFHTVVETYGNLVGDLLLKEFARELRSSCRFTDIVGRWGSDEFVILMDDAGAENRPQVERLRSSVSRRYHVPGRTGYVNVSLAVTTGIAECRGGEDVQELIGRADQDLCRDKALRVREKSA